jgi:hypothetical protein
MQSSPFRSAFTALLLMLSSACSFTEAVEPTQLDFTERGVFTQSGRFFVIGARPDDQPDMGAWIVEMSKGSADGSYVTTDLVAGRDEGTVDGKLGSAPRGEPCTFSGMAVQGELLYATCVLSDSSRAALLQVDLTARTVRAGYFTTCNFEPAASDCQFSQLYPNGMAVDAAGRIYVSDTSAHAGELVGDAARHTLTQISVDAAASKDGKLVFRHRAWFSADIFTDGLAPNGIQIDGDVLYYAAGSNINKIRIRADGSAGEFRVHYTGPLDVLIDDFNLHEGEIFLALVVPPAVVGLSAAPWSDVAHETGRYDMPVDAIPSSVSYQPEGRALHIFPKDSLVLTSYFGGGVQVLPRAQVE